MISGSCLRGHRRGPAFPENGAQIRRIFLRIAAPYGARLSCAGQVSNVCHRLKADHQLTRLVLEEVLP